MSYRLLDHTGELALEVKAADGKAAFAEVAQAVGELLADAGKAQRGPQAVRIELCQPDRESLLVAFVNELIYLAERYGRAPAKAQVELLEGGRLVADVVFSKRAARPLLKAATYHELRFEEGPTGTRAAVVIDV